MNGSSFQKTFCAGLALLWVVARASAGGDADATRAIIDWRTFPKESIEARGAVAAADTNGWLELHTRKESGRVGLKVRPVENSRNLAAFSEIAVPVRNLGSNDLQIILRVDDPSTENLPTVQTRKCIFQTWISPGPDPVWLVVPLGDSKASPLDGRFISMVGQPVDFIRRGAVDGANVSAISIFTPDPDEDHSFAIGPLIVRGSPALFRNWPAEKVFPIVDQFGQYAHRDWTNKIHSAKDFDRQKKLEDADLAANPRPAGWNRYGGWTAGPKLQATGFFRVQKVGGAWWLVDPQGCLFWSHGVVRVGTRVRVGSEYRGTPLTDRESFFKLPGTNSAFGSFYGTEPQSTRRYYVGRDNHAVYDFLEANLFQKYGADWRAGYAVQAQRRLASWGLNTIANSSDPAICSRQQTPYTAIVYSAPLGRSEFRLEGSAGNWGKLPDPFDPGWRQLIDRTLRADLKESLNDPWCIGFFVDNELHWGDVHYIGESTLSSPKDQPAKKAMIEGLKEKYKEIGRLNSAWGTAFIDWDALLGSTRIPPKSRSAVRQDLAAFSELYLAAYFRGCHDAIQTAAPKHMYLGCRFAGSGNDIVMRVAARYCDIVSINRYANSVADLRLPDGLDRPILIGEFHFTAMDAPMQPSGLVLTANHRDRARAYITYVKSALRNPAVIGTHWFQFYDQPATGRFDGENYQTGLLDICDTPYSETVAACRQMGNRLYQIRSQAFVPAGTSN